MVCLVTLRTLLHLLFHYFSLSHNTYEIIKNVVIILVIILVIFIIFIVVLIPSELRGRGPRASASADRRARRSSTSRPRIASTSSSAPPLLVGSGTPGSRRSWRHSIGYGPLRRTCHDPPEWGSCSRREKSVVKSVVKTS